MRRTMMASIKTALFLFLHGGECGRLVCSAHTLHLHDYLFIPINQIINLFIMCFMIWPVNASSASPVDCKLFGHWASLHACGLQGFFLLPPIQMQEWLIGWFTIKHKSHSRLWNRCVRETGVFLGATKMSSWWHPGSPKQQCLHQWDTVMVFTQVWVFYGTMETLALTFNSVLLFEFGYYYCFHHLFALLGVVMWHPEGFLFYVLC